MTAAIAASGVFIKAIESHFQLSNELVKVKNAMKMLSELDHDVKALGASPSKPKVDEFSNKFHAQMKKVSDGSAHFALTLLVPPHGERGVWRGEEE